MTAPHSYITTTIPYVNARPHIGFALELVQADVLARYRRGRGEAVRFQAGTDDNSLKNVLAAQAAGVEVREFVDRNAEAFVALGDALSLSVDDVIRTSRDSRHRPGVERFWRACTDTGDLYRKRYEGLYCTGCEQFHTPTELRDGRCPEHETVPQLLTEENWFFRLSRYAEPLREAIASGRLRIELAGRRNEVLAFIDGGLEDFSATGPGTEPAALAAQYGVDAVRWWLLREVPRVGDADFTVERLIARADDELANGFGNLVNRVVSMIGRYRDGHLPAGSQVPGGEELEAACRQADDAIGAALADFDFRQATAAVWGIAAEANRFVNRVRPWELAKAERTGDLAAGERLDAVLGVLLEACSVLGRVLTPFLPDAAARITLQCAPGRDGRLPGPSPVFRRLSVATATGLEVGEPQQEQQHDGAYDRSNALTGKLALQRGAEARGDAARADPLAEPLGFGGYRRRSLGADVLEQPDRDLAVLALRPAADNPAVPPGRGADVP